MISFVAYFSSAEDEEGFVVMNGHGWAPAAFTGGPLIESGIYRIEGDTLVRIEAGANDIENEAAVE